MFGKSMIVALAPAPAKPAGDAEVKQLLLLMDRDQNGKVSREAASILVVEVQYFESQPIYPRQIGFHILAFIGAKEKFMGDDQGNGKILRLAKIYIISGLCFKRNAP